MKFFLSPQQLDLTLNDFMSVINFKNDEEKHSNQWTVINNIALEVELFFASVANNDISGFGLNDLFFSLPERRESLHLDWEKNRY